MTQYMEAITQLAPRSDFSSVSLKMRHSDLALINKLEQVKVSQKIYM